MGPLRWCQVDSLTLNLSRNFDVATIEVQLDGWWNLSWSNKGGSSPDFSLLGVIPQKPRMRDVKSPEVRCREQSKIPRRYLASPNTIRDYWTGILTWASWADKRLGQTSGYLKKNPRSHSELRLVFEKSCLPNGRRRFRYDRESGCNKRKSERTFVITSFLHQLK